MLGVTTQRTVSSSLLGGRQDVQVKGEPELWSVLRVSDGFLGDIAFPNMGLEMEWERQRQNKSYMEEVEKYKQEIMTEGLQVRTNIRNVSGHNSHRSISNWNGPFCQPPSQSIWRGLEGWPGSIWRYLPDIYLEKLDKTAKTSQHISLVCTYWTHEPGSSTSIVSDYRLDERAV
jgi:hypothetical protein